ncbi:MAG: hypothetical protein AAF266_06895 [Planctomycetota bacterium]
MRVSVHAPEATPELIGSARDRFTAGLRRYASIVRDVAVQIRDENGPRGGRDQACTVRIALKGGEEVCIREKSNTPLQAIGHALKRVRRVVSEKINARPRKRRRGVRSAPE